MNMNMFALSTDEIEILTLKDSGRFKSKARKGPSLEKIVNDSSFTFKNESYMCKDNVFHSGMGKI
jgi:hypothetical protein